MAKSYEIFPSIGIARLGSSVATDGAGVFSGFYLGPEPGLVPPTQYRDGNGKLKRQAARFRVFECDRDAAGRLMAATELTGQPNVQVTWTATLANRKAAAPNFLNSGGRRNAATGNPVTDRDLIIGPITQTFAGTNATLKQFNGAFRTSAVHLGQAWTDAAQRLLIVGGLGRSRKLPVGGSESIEEPGSFADNDDWYDDTSDGPIQAQVKLADGSTVTAKAAWLIVGPFDFAPPIQNFVTLYDAIFQATGGVTPLPVSFTGHVYPILSRAVGYQWVTARAVLGHGGTGPGNFSNRWAMLADPAMPANVRTSVVNRLRNPGTLPPTTAISMPRLHDETNTSDVLPPTAAQWAVLQQWAAGAFTNDWNPTIIDPDEIEKSRAILLGELLPTTLTRTALEGCSGGAFFPGIEVGRIVQQAGTFSEPFRIATMLAAGDLTQGNAIPWQADFVACAWDAHLKIGWWPAQRPDNVFPVTSPTILKAWDDGINTASDMVQLWDQAGVVRKVISVGNIKYLEGERLLPHA